MFSAYISQAQIIQLNVSERFEKALEMYNSGNYGKASIEFEKIMHANTLQNNYEAESAYYYASCSLHLNQKRGYTLMHNFVDHYAGSKLATSGSLELGSKYFENASYDDALLYLKNVDETKLDETKLDEFYYKRGFCYLNRSEYKQARSDLQNVVSNSDRTQSSMYDHAAHSYLAFIFYEEGMYANSLSHLSEIEDDPEFKGFVDTYKCQILLKKGSIDQALTMAKALYKESEGAFKGDMARLIGEAYYLKSDYTEALPYFVEYDKLATSKNDQSDYYYAYCLFHAKKYEKAKDIFVRVADNKSALGQNSLYHVGACCDELGDKSNALNALLKASKMDYDEKISEDSFFLATKISYLQNWNATNDPLDMFRDYVKKYPLCDRNREAYHFLALTFSNTPNHKKALEIIETLPSIYPEMQVAYEINCNRLALNSFMLGEYRNAIDMFNKAGKYNFKSEREEATAYYWSGESYYYLKDYDKALTYYKKYQASPGAYLCKQGTKVSYSIGYCYYMQKDYKSAQKYFERFIYGYKDSSKPILADSYNRNGDCFYVMNQLGTALAQYDRAYHLNSSNPDYSLFQSANIYNITNNTSKEEETLQRLLKYFPNSIYAVYSHLQIGKSLRNRNAIDQSKGEFKKVVESNDSQYVPEALLGLSGIYIREHNYSAASDALKSLIENYPSSDKRERALAKLRSVYVNNNDPDGFVDYVKKNHISVSKSDIDRDVLAFQAIESHYSRKVRLNETVEFSQFSRSKPLSEIDAKREPNVLLASGAKDNDLVSYNHTSAYELSLKKYLNSFPNGKYRREICRYLVEFYDSLGDSKKSYMYTNMIIRMGRGPFYASSLKNAASYLMKEKRYDESVLQYQRMMWIEGDKEANVTGFIGYIRASFAAAKWNNVVKGAEKIKNYGNLSTSLKNEVLYLQGLSYLKMRQDDLALKSMERVKYIDYNDTYSVNSVYRRGVLLYQKGAYDDCINLLLKVYGPKVGPNPNVLARYYIVACQAMIAKNDKLSAKVWLKGILDQNLNIDAKHKNELEKIYNSIIQEEQKSAAPKSDSTKKEPGKTGTVHF
ncbi:tetratricopeptide repeat protein [Halosquirtibacter laminarini]|uniref:Tetratricopeptide repeat protein n=1 Tax=Halosquirtibacter laminarini TaxID=3374600 RepID=A0AC61NCH8_9BACT|nr:tetratricopeptide repeat protein [Prolixibacteraceae bacterium]